MALPAAYADLTPVNVPRMVAEALPLYGTVETAGAANSPIIMAWAKEAGLEASYTADSVPWCGLFMAIVARRAGWAMPAKPLWALNWSKWGVDAGQPELGDVLVFTRGGGGHVGIYVGEDRTHFHVLGGNQADAVNIMRIGKNRLYAARRPEWRQAEPPTRRPIIRAATGAISTDEG